MHLLMDADIDRSGQPGVPRRSPSSTQPPPHPCPVHPIEVPWGRSPLPLAGRGCNAGARRPAQLASVIAESETCPSVYETAAGRRARHTASWPVSGSAGKTDASVSWGTDAHTLHTETPGPTPTGQPASNKSRQAGGSPRRPAWPRAEPRGVLCRRDSTSAWR